MSSKWVLSITFSRQNPICTSPVSPPSSARDIQLLVDTVWTRGYVSPLGMVATNISACTGLRTQSQSAYAVKYIWRDVLYDLCAFFSHGAAAPRGPGPPHCRGFTITLRHTTLGRTPLDEWSARRRDLYLITHNTHKRQTSMPVAGFEPTIPERERTKTHNLDRAAIGIGSVQLPWGLRKDVFSVWIRSWHQRPGLESCWSSGEIDMNMHLDSKR
jgi:hypothetical protein